MSAYRKAFSPPFAGRDEYIDKHLCCNCGACVAVCPKHCITMKLDDEGFYYPETDRDVCVKCGACGAVCVINGTVARNERQPEAFAVRAKDGSARARSASGGVAPLLEEFVLSRCGVVFGAAFDEEFNVKTMYAQHINDTNIFRGSKYVESLLGGGFNDAKSFLDAGREVLYVGLPCQIEALRKYLGKEYTNLTAVGLLCAGVGSSAVWKSYLSEIQREHHGKIRRIFMRDKSLGWRRYSMSIDLDNGLKYLQPVDKDPYLRYFCVQRIVRPSCHTCLFKGFDRPYDLTIGDFWGIDKFHNDLDDNKGTSVVLVHSEKGKKTLAAISSQAEIRSAQFEDAVMYNTRRPWREYPARELFYENFRAGVPLSELVYMKMQLSKDRLDKSIGNARYQKIGLYAVMPETEEILQYCMSSEWFAGRRFFVYDRDSTKQGTSVCGVKVSSPEMIAQDDLDILIIVNEVSYDAIRKTASQYMDPAKIAPRGALYEWGM